MTSAERSAYGNTMADFMVRQRAADALLEAVVVEREAYAALRARTDFYGTWRRHKEVEVLRDKAADKYLAALRTKGAEAIATTKLDEPVPYVVAETLPTPPALADLIASGSPITADDIDDEPDYAAIAEAGEFDPFYGDNIYRGGA